MAAKKRTKLVMRRDRVESIIRAWVVEFIHGSPIAQNTSAWNHLHDSLPVLVDNICLMDEAEE